MNSEERNEKLENFIRFIENFVSFFLQTNDRLFKYSHPFSGSPILDLFPTKTLSRLKGSETKQLERLHTKKVAWSRNSRAVVGRTLNGLNLETCFIRGSLKENGRRERKNSGWQI